MPSVTEDRQNGKPCLAPQTPDRTALLKIAQALEDLVSLFGGLKAEMDAMAELVKPLTVQGSPRCKECGRPVPGASGEAESIVCPACLSRLTVSG